MEQNKLLITGGTGSFGTAFLKKAVANNEFSEIRIFLSHCKLRYHIF